MIALPLWLVKCDVTYSCAADTDDVYSTYSSSSFVGSALILLHHFHDLRHEATSRFFELSLNVVEVAAITGHKDIKMLQRYTHLRAEALARKLQ